MKKGVTLIILSFMSSYYAWAQENEKGSGKEKVIYKYRKYQKFDFEDLEIDGETGLPDALSVERRRDRSKYKNKLPYRKNFNAEIRKGIERIR